MKQRSAIAIVVTGLLAAGVVFFEPWTLLTSSTVVEAAPVAASPTTSPEPGEPAPTVVEPQDLARGEFVSQEHRTTGTARVIEQGDGQRILRLEDFSTSNGPDLHVWLSDKKAGGSWFKYGGGRSVRLGELKANRGSHNYAIPADADLDGLRSVVIWCKRFHVSFGSAAIDR